ncbi:zinc-binding dehydrogenase [Woeseia oceani]|uniref:Enoyl reductase (ER) domain-containing protein n=1 Tax=Woeseia oceani TaxID=1548547 RepID=A0A193LDJ6_9GAMM|nr:zinc-binding dehydrogenase [Woeseia oceani]ANO50511.1 hypothetical protein BA177_04155 [Woeseia oceani]
MKAVEIHQYGAARDVLRLSHNAPRPILAADEILIENHATSVNPVDCAARSGYGQNFFSRLGWGDLPMILGRDASGVVVAKGKDVAGVEIGDEVYAAPPIGCYAEYVKVKAVHAAPKPRNISHSETAALPFIALTAWTALVTNAGLTAENATGKKIVVPRAAGGVGSFAVQLLKAWGAEVAAICSTRNIELVRSLGADTVIDYTQQDFRDHLQDYDVAFDLIGRKSDFDELDNDYKGGTATADGSHYDEQLMSVLREDANAVYVTVCSPKVALTNKYGYDEGVRQADIEYANRANAAANKGYQYVWSFFDPNAAPLRAVACLIEEGKIKPVIDKAYPLADIVKAHEYCETKQAQGKIVIDIR